MINKASAAATTTPPDSLVSGLAESQTVVDASSMRMGRFRWSICALLFFAATINYVDRQVIGILKPTLQGQLHWSESDYGWIVFAFQTAYAIGMLLVGRLMDKLGTRKGFSLAVVFWSVAAMAHAFASSALGFGVARFALGLGEAGNFPASIKTVAEWFPKKERALATGIFNSGTNIGALITPLVVPWITLVYGWRWAFIATGALGFTWLIAWLVLYYTPENHPRLQARERAHIQSDPPEPLEKIAWTRLFPHRQTWAFAIGKFLTDPIWWLYLFWLPDFFSKSHGLDLKTIGPPLVTIYIAADVGSIAGGWLSSTLIKRGWNINAARKTAMLACALCVVPVAFAPRVPGLWSAVALISLAAAAHQGWSANLFTLTSDMFPRRAVGSVVGIGGMAGAIGGMFIARVVAEILQRTGSYVPIFIIACSAYLVALLLVQLLTPRLEPARIDV
ncbi:MAG TPA: MFS transporter [Blastocatellia bacterium]|jgi:ACS family hexuronate transporter-like MFS transporter|nr:MFS transporter [Blastocatellia bacterium]